MLHNFFDQVKTFENKLPLCEVQLLRWDFTHFYNNEKYSDALWILRPDFSNRSQEFRTNEKLLKVLSTPFSVMVGDAPSNMQMELIELQCDLKEKFKNV